MTDNMLESWSLIKQRDIFLNSEHKLLERLEDDECNRLTKLVEGYETLVTDEYYADYVYLLQNTI